MGATSPQGHPQVGQGIASAHPPGEREARRGPAMLASELALRWPPSFCRAPPHTSEKAAAPSSAGRLRKQARSSSRTREPAPRPPRAPAE